MFGSFERMVAFRYLRARRKEGFISVIAGFSLLGIALGVATLIIVMAVMNGFRAELLDRILGVNAHISISRYGVAIADYDNFADKIRRIDGVEKAVPIVDGQVMATANGMSGGALIKGIKKSDLERKEIIAGNLKAGDFTDFTGSDAVIIGQRMAENMGLRVGSGITLVAPKTTDTIIGSIPRMKDYEVVGIFEVGMYEYDNTYIFMPLENAQTYLRYRERVNSIEIMVDDRENVRLISDAIMRAAGPEYQVIDWEQINSHFFNSLKVERNVMFLILTLIIIVAAFNIISSMIMLVNDKSRAIAILRTMGASRGAIMRIFFLCGSSIGVVGTLLGFLLGLGFATNIETIRNWLEQATNTELFSAEIYFLSQLPADVRMDDVVSVVVMALGLSLLATIYPAWRSARVNPAEGVRYE